MKSVLKVKSKNTQVTQEKVEPKYVEDKATKQYLDYINDHGNVMRHNGKDYYNTGINLKGPRGAVGPRGLPGKDGITPHIGENGNWYIGEQDTGSKAELNTDEYVTKEELEDVIGNAPEALDTLKELSDAIGGNPDFATNINNIINNKVDKIVGKGLSTNDYTNEDKNKLTTHTSELQTLAAALQQLNTDLIGLRSMLTNNAGTLKAVGLELETLPIIMGEPLETIGSGAPSITPEFIGQRYYDSSNNKEYVAVAVTASTNDWRAV